MTESLSADVRLTSMGRNSTLHPISEFGGGGLKSHRLRVGQVQAGAAPHGEGGSQVGQLLR